MAREPAIAAGKRLRSLRCLANRCRIVAEGIGVGREHIRTKAVTVAWTRHQKLANGIPADAELLHHVLFHGDGIEIVRLLLTRNSCFTQVPVFKEFFARRIRDGRAFELLGPWIDDPHARLLAKVGAEINAERWTDIFEVPADIDFGRRTLPGLVFKFTDIDANRFKQYIRGRARARCAETDRALRRIQVVAVDDEFVLLCLATEDRMVFEHEALGVRRMLLAVERRCQATEAAANNHQVEDLARIVSGKGRIGEDMVTDLMTGRHHLERVAVGLRIITDAAIAGPVVLAHLGQ